MGGAKSRAKDYQINRTIFWQKAHFRIEQEFSANILKGVGDLITTYQSLTESSANIQGGKILTPLLPWESYLTSTATAGRRVALFGQGRFACLAGQVRSSICCWLAPPKKQQKLT
ncbi:MAG TPA: hypothetical protein DEF05_15220 [Erwinia sp.]|nr:hypothetical protein [Erwinia sp.]